MKSKPFIFGIVAAFLLAAALWFFGNGIREPAAPQDSVGLIVGKNAVYVAEQAPSQTVMVTVARFENTGFVIIHKEENGAAGKILGVSGLVPAGESRNFEVALSRRTADGEDLIAMLHFDDGDGVFSAVRDKPVIDSVSGEPAATIVTVSEDAGGAGAVNL